MLLDTYIELLKVQRFNYPRHSLGLLHSLPGQTALQDMSHFDHPINDKNKPSALAIAPSAFSQGIYLHRR